MTTVSSAPARRAQPAPAATPLPRWRGSTFPTQVLVLTGRSLTSYLRDPRLVFFSLFQPLIMLLLFSQVFSGVGQLPGLSGYGGYINYLMPAILVTTTLTTAMGSGVGLLTEMDNGVVARLRSLPIRLFSVLLARSLSELIRMAVQLLLMVLVAVAAFGFRPAGGVLGVGAALLLALTVGWSLQWVFLLLATWVRKPEVLQSVSFLAMFPWGCRILEGQIFPFAYSKLHMRFL